MSRRRYVFDTNTVVSAFLFDGSTPGRALKVARRRGQLLLSVETARELSEVLEREKFDRYVRRETRREFLVAVTTFVFRVAGDSLYMSGPVEMVDSSGKQVNDFQRMEEVRRRAKKGSDADW